MHNIVFQDIVTESSSFDIVAFMPLLRERIYTANAYAKQFLVSWVSKISSQRSVVRESHDTIHPRLGACFAQLYPLKQLEGKDVDSIQTKGNEKGKLRVQKKKWGKKG